MLHLVVFTANVAPRWEKPARDAGQRNHRNAQVNMLVT